MSKSGKLDKGIKTYILLGIVICVSLIIMAFNRFVVKSGDTAVISVDGEVIKELPLSEDTTFTISGYDGGENVLTIHSGECYMEEADCPDKLCVKQGHISKEGESIICLPHRIVITIKGHDDTGLDTMSK